MKEKSGFKVGDYVVNGDYDILGVGKITKIVDNHVTIKFGSISCFSLLNEIKLATPEQRKKKI